MIMMHSSCLWEWPKKVQSMSKSKWRTQEATRAFHQNTRVVSRICYSVPIVLIDTVGIMSKIISHLEDHPFLPTLDPRGPYLKYLNCMADHGPTFPKELKKEVKNPKKWHKLAKKLAAESRKLNSFLATTQAVDLIQGGVKVNALPEVVTGESS
jgi:hypothetical protein